jgi:fructosamine-3-kinase
MVSDSIIAKALRQVGDDTPIAERTVVGGGSISQALRLRTARGEYLLKAGAPGLPGFFAAEARGLALLASASAVRVPAALAHYDAEEVRGWRLEARDGFQGSSLKSQASSDGFILLEWLPSPPHADRARAGELLGAALAAMHHATALRQAQAPQPYGLDHDNYIGATPQPNGPMASWLAFFRERRLGFQAELAQRNGHMRGERVRRLERLLNRLGEWIDDRATQPALLHGDLWGGNFIIGPGGAPVLIDPAAYYGDREADLAMTRLFGGFPPGFYRAYEAIWPLPDGWRERVGLYNLYHLLNHMNLFGESYGAEVDAILRRYVG